MLDQLDLPLDLSEVSITRSVVDLDLYAGLVADAAAAHKANPSYDTALELSRCGVHALIEAAGEDVEILISSSWGKDSTAMTAVVVDVLLERLNSGRRTLPVHIITAHTGNEFVEMEERIGFESNRIAMWAKRAGLQITTQVVSPLAKNQLLSELIGAGRPLPSYSNSTSAKSSEWCVDRLKVGPQEAALEAAAARGKKLIHMLGTRADESAKRAVTCALAGKDLPPMLANLALGSVAVQRQGVQPIVHWTHEDLTLFLQRNVAAWNALSFEALKAIYRQGASEEEANGAAECRITFTADGGVSNVCSDLGGARFGCMLCVKSKNRSLINYARNNPRYRWINAVHKFIYAGIRQHAERLDDIKAHGFTTETLFPKNMTFFWRYRLAMLVCRAEMESGFTLVSPEVEEAINAWWTRSGVFTVRFSDARADAFRWKRTGNRTPSFLDAAARFDSMSVSLSSGIPAGVYAHFENPAMAPLRLPQLVPLAGAGNTFYPVIYAYVFRDTVRGDLVTVITDCLSDMGRTLNTDCMSGLEPFNLQLLGMREPTAWERSLMKGRMIWYRWTHEGLAARVSKLLGSAWDRSVVIDEDEGEELTTARRSGRILTAGEAARNLAHILLADEALHEWVQSDKALADHLDEQHFIAEGAGRLNADEFRDLYRSVSAAVVGSEALTHHHEDAVRAIRKAFGSELSSLRADGFGGNGDTRALITKLVREGWDIAESFELFLAYREEIAAIDRFLVAGKASIALINRLAFIVRASWYDRSWSTEMLTALLRLADVRGVLVEQQDSPREVEVLCA